MWTILHVGLAILATLQLIIVPNVFASDEQREVGDISDFKPFPGECCKGNTIGNGEQIDVDACAVKCFETNKCKGFAMYSGKCYLKEKCKENSLEADGNCDAYIMLSSSERNKDEAGAVGDISDFKPFPGECCKGNTIGNGEQIDVDACAVKCFETNKCKGFAMYSGKCYLKEKCKENSLEADGNCDAYIMLSSSERNKDEAGAGDINDFDDYPSECCKGDTIGDRHDLSPEDCALKCLGEDKCKGFAMYNGKCYLKKKCKKGSLEQDNKCTSYIKKGSGEGGDSDDKDDDEEGGKGDISDFDDYPGDCCKGDTIGDRQDLSPEDCALKCLGEDKCKGFAMYDGKCYLKKKCKKGSLEKDDKCTSYIKKGSGEGGDSDDDKDDKDDDEEGGKGDISDFDDYPGDCCKGDTIGDRQDLSPEDCALKCLGEDKCKGFAMYDGKCYLKKKCKKGSLEKDDKCTSYIKKGKGGSNEGGDSDDNDSHGGKGGGSGGGDTGVCSASGDPHYRTYDSRLIHFQGPCKYLLTGTVAGATLEPFSVQVKNEYRRGKTHVTFTRYGEVEVYGHVIQLSEFGIQVDGIEENVPFDFEDVGVSIELAKSGFFVLTTDFGLKVKAKGSIVMVEPPLEYMEQMEGICGNFNGNGDDDFVTKEGVATESYFEIGNSWEVPDAAEPDCLAPLADEPAFDEIPQDVVDKPEYCGLFKENTVFADCLNDMGEQALAEYAESCKFDVAALLDRGADVAHEAACEIIEATAKECADKFGDIANWRTQSNCPMKCKKGMVYSEDAPKCPVTCADPDGDKCKGDGPDSGEGCVCPEGKVLSGTKCVDAAKCGCKVKGRYYMAGDSVMSKNCKKKYTCVGKNDIRKEDVGCKAGEQCLVERGRARCDVAQCHCVFHGDPHYNTHDLVTIHYQGTCRYKLAAPVQGQGLPDFKVVTKNEHRKGQTKVAHTRYVDVTVAGVVFRLDQERKVLRNGIKIGLPYDVAGVSIYEQAGRYVVLATNFGLKVKFNGDANGELTLPADTFAGKLTGLCGNCNGDAADDMRTADGSSVRGKRKEQYALIGNSYVEPDPENPDCFKPTADDPIPEPSRDVIENPEYCGMLQNDDRNPLLPCLKRLGRETWGKYLDSCTMDVVMQIGDETVAHDAGCVMLDTIANECAREGVPVTGWREPSNCPMDCRATMVFSPRAPKCPQTCVGTDACKEIGEQEGCMCPEGTVLSDDQCVPSANCGCTDGDGVYHKASSKWTAADCSEEYTCAASGKKPAEITTVAKGCGQNEKCVIEDGEPVCLLECPTGYVMNAAETECLDVNECEAANPPTCKANAHCENNEGGHDCVCDDGFEDVNEECVKKAVDCDQGYHYDEGQDKCVDDDECDTNPCGNNANCGNIPGSYMCTCIEGYEGDAVAGCTDRNECTEDPSPANCDVNARCVNTEPGFKCVCNNFYEGNGETCTDRNECTEDPSPAECDPNGHCVNKEPEFDCECNEGYVGNGYSCIDDDECRNNPCGANADCGNTAGSFTCTCKDGYEGDAIAGCTDRNECTEVPSPATCGNNAHCVNTEPGFDCECDDGFEGDGSICTVKNPCEPNPCGVNAVCTVNGDSYTCACKEGYQGVPTVFCQFIAMDVPTCPAGYKMDSTNGCVDVDECNLGEDECDENASCENTAGSYTCTCKTGYEGDGRQCTNVNECADGSHKCDANADCSDNEGGYTCTCKPGYKMNGISCTDIDECTEVEDACQENSLCMNIPAGLYTCLCLPGYEQQGDLCVDINECDRNTDQCDDNAACANTDGSYTCACSEGYEGDGRVCTNINECDEDLDQCSDNAVCADTEASYTCTCRDGYTGDGIACTDVDECKAEVYPCHGAARCRNTQGSFECTCQSGFNGDGFGCTDVDECFENKDDCHENADCKNIPGTFLCECSAGYVGNGRDCSDKDECALDTDNCDENAQCKNTVGSFDCVCNPGYSGSGETCTDDNECGQTPTPCGANGVCRNQPGSYTCDCNPGYDFDGTTCTDVQECTTGANICDANADCENTEGGYHCRCRPGYTGNGQVCTDLDECARGEDNCIPSAECVNNDGGFSCKCKTGFIGDGSVCDDIDECALDQDNCSDDASCENEPGTFVCRCDTGLTGNGVTCTDINECEDNRDNCSPDATCANVKGSFTCTCNPGFDGDGIDCSDTDECSNNPCSPNAVCQDSVGSYTCTCNEGYSGNGEECTDINECEEDPDSCQVESFCMNFPAGSFTCICLNGYEKQGDLCVDKDECARGEDNCDPNAKCLNNDGGFDCECNEGYSGDGSLCNDINECDNPDSCPDNSVCENTPAGSFTCNCVNGYTQEGDFCVDYDECARGEHDCTPPAECFNTDGGFECRCGEGYTGDGSSCTDIDECEAEVDPCPVNSMCMNSPAGSFTCVCLSGFEKQGDACVDINECLTGTATCAENAECKNENGRYTCECVEGYEGDGHVECTRIPPTSKLT